MFGSKGMVLVAAAMLVLACADTTAPRTGESGPSLASLNDAVRDSVPRPVAPPSGTLPDTGVSPAAPTGFVGAVWGLRPASAAGDSLVRVAGATVRILKPVTAEAVATTLSKEDGAFQFNALPDGDFRLHALPPAGSMFGEHGYAISVRDGRLTTFTYLNIVLPRR